MAARVKRNLATAFADPPAAAAGVAGTGAVQLFYIICTRTTTLDYCKYGKDCKDDAEAKAEATACDGTRLHNMGPGSGCAGGCSPLRQAALHSGGGSGEPEIFMTLESANARAAQVWVGR